MKKNKRSMLKKLQLSSDIFDNFKNVNDSIRRQLKHLIDLNMS